MLRGWGDDRQTRTAFGMTSSAFTDARTVVSAWGRLGTTKLSAGIFRRDRDIGAR